MKNVIQYDHTKLTSKEQAFVDNTIKKANDNDVSVHIIQKRSVSGNGSTPCGGYVTDEPRLMAVATGKPKSRWFPIFLHESCHLDQLIEQAPAWTNTKIQGADTNDLVFLWVDGMIELNKDQLKKYIYHSTMVELDCEMRVVVKILNNGFDINVDTYTQRANAYVYYYLMLARTRKWYTIGREPYNVEEVWSQMPNHFNNDYTKLPRTYTNLYKRYCY